jgi:eukaryotic translation initiation factor 2C
MIRYACNPPRYNAETIVGQGLQTLGLAPSATPVNGFGVEIGTEMAVIPARELPPPNLAYRSGKPNVKSGSWNILDVKFQQGATVRNWWVLVVNDGRPEFSSKDDPRLTGLAAGFAAKCSRSGITMPGNMPQAFIATSPLPAVHEDPSRIRAIEIIRRTISQKLGQYSKPSFILVLLSGIDNYIYPGIKKIGEVELGIHTVHMLLSKVLKDSKKQDQYFSNVALKVNTKLGGINHLLDAASMKWLTAKKTMIVGMDVTHPGPTSISGTPSVAAVVASVDDYFVQYPASMRVQKSKQEESDSTLSDMFLI